jgi:curli biogenesis system outer membrane secretion channel CsgG
MNHTRLLIVAAMAVALALFAAATVSSSPLQLAEAHKQKQNNGCRNAICIGVNGNQDSANDNDKSFDFYIG